MAAKPPVVRTKRHPKKTVSYPREPSENAVGCSREPSGPTLPSTGGLGQSINFSSPWAPVQLTVELPFWMLVPAGQVTVDVEGHTFLVSIEDAYVEVFGRGITDSRATCLFQGPGEAAERGTAIAKAILAGHATMVRKCKTVLRIWSRCASDVLEAARSGEKRRRDAQWYFIALCSAHLPIVNRLVQAYRVATYDLAAFEVSPWDVPVWLIRGDTLNVARRVSILREAERDSRLTVKNWADRDKPEAPWETVQFTDLATLSATLADQVSISESALLDADNLMHRGDYSGAVRRTVTAIEVLVAEKLRQELAKLWPDTDVVRRMRASENDFPGRLRQLQKLSGRAMPSNLAAQLESTRHLRHEIVHAGRRIPYAERGLAQKCVDIGRWTYSWIEDDEARKTKRDRLVAGPRNLGLHVVFFKAQLGPEGVTVDNIDT
jgi:hypothetical protein